LNDNGKQSLKIGTVPPTGAFATHSRPRTAPPVASSPQHPHTKQTQKNHPKKKWRCPALYIKTVSAAGAASGKAINDPKLRAKQPKVQPSEVEAENPSGLTRGSELPGVRSPAPSSGYRGRDRTSRSIPPRPALCRGFKTALWASDAFLFKGPPGPRGHLGGSSPVPLDFVQG